MREGWFALASFDMDAYKRLDDPVVDVHKICPKFVAFRGPDVRVAGLGDVGKLCCEFKKLGVTAGVRVCVNTRMHACLYAYKHARACVHACMHAYILEEARRHGRCPSA